MLPCTSRCAVYCCMALIAVLALPAAARSSTLFDKSDEQGFKHLSNALVSFRKAMRVSKLDTPEDWKHFATLLDHVHGECAVISDSTLQKVGQEFAVQIRSNLDGGCNTLAVAIHRMMEAKEAGRAPGDDVIASMRDGHRRMTLFHEYYNSHFSAIVDGLRKKGMRFSE